MKIDFSKPILGLDGVPLKVQDLDGHPDFTIRDACVNALLSDRPASGRPDEPKIDGKEKVRRFRLAQKIYGCKEPINLESDDIVLLKNKIAEVYPTLTTARAWEILEGLEVADPKAPGDPK